jgi:hypothetical protein
MGENLTPFRHLRDSPENNLDRGKIKIVYSSPFRISDGLRRSIFEKLGFVKVLKKG